MTTAVTRLCLLALLLAGLASLTIHTYPAIFSEQTAPVPADELLRLNPG